MSPRTRVQRPVSCKTSSGIYELGICARGLYFLYGTWFVLSRCRRRRPIREVARDKGRPVRSVSSRARGKARGAGKREGSVTSRGRAPTQVHVQIRRREKEMAHSPARSGGWLMLAGLGEREPRGCGKRERGGGARSRASERAPTPTVGFKRLPLASPPDDDGRAGSVSTSSHVFVHRRLCRPSRGGIPPPSPALGLRLGLANDRRASNEGGSTGRRRHNSLVDQACPSRKGHVRSTRGTRQATSRRGKTENCNVHEPRQVVARPMMYRHE
jgi:hypothetical protein